jgi:hypothetical protein
VRFAVTPKGADSRRAIWLAAVKWQLSIAALALAGVAYQTVAQILDLPGRLTPFAFVVTVVWSLLSAGLLAAVVVWAGRVRHRRQAHRFPVSLEAAYALDGAAAPDRPARVTDLNPFGLSMETAEPLSVGQRLRLTLLLDTGPMSVDGAVARVDPGGDRARSGSAGVRFDELDQEAQDAIRRWCFAQPFGPAYPLRGVESTPHTEHVEERARARA